MTRNFIFEIHTPYRLFYDNNKVRIVTLPLIDGEKGIYARHSAFIAITVPGLLRIKEESGTWKPAFISNGILEVKEFKNVLLVDAAEWAEEIDTDRAKKALVEAEEKINTSMFKFEITAAQAAARRARLRLQIAEGR
jgi:F-type H+-transporting ATPase subunit epsilon